SPTPTESPSPSPSESPTAFESFPPPADYMGEQELAVRQGVADYWEVFARFAADPTLTDLTDTQRVTEPGSAEAQLIMDQIATLREEKVRIEGQWRFRNLEI